MASTITKIYILGKATLTMGSWVPAMESNRTSPPNILNYTALNANQKNSGRMACATLNKAQFNVFYVEPAVLDSAKRPRTAK
jgi:hypothetical protein